MKSKLDEEVKSWFALSRSRNREELALLTRAVNSGSADDIRRAGGIPVPDYPPP